MVIPCESPRKGDDDGSALAGTYWQITTDALFAAAESAGDLVILDANPAFRKMVGLPVGGPRAHLKMATLPHPWGIRLASAIQEAQKGLSDQKQFSTAIDIQGEVYCVSSVAVTNSGGRHVIIARVHRNTTKVPLAEGTSEVAERSYALLNAVLGALSGRLAIIDSEGMIVACNGAWRAFALRMGHDPVPGTPFKWIPLTDSPARQAREVEQARVTLRALLSGKTSTMSRTCRSGTSTRQWYQVTAVRFLHQQQVFVVFAIEDITESREARNATEHSSKLVLALQASERQRIATELHDSTAQHLAVIGLNAAMLRARSPQDTETLELWEELDWCLSQASTEFRTLSYMLRPARLGSEGLLASLRRFADEFASRTGVQFRLRVDHRLNQVSLVKQKALLQLAQEVALQVRRKGRATRMVISQKLIRNTLHFVLQTADASRLGEVSEGLVALSSVRYRLQRLGGRVDLRVRRNGMIFHAQVTCGNARKYHPASHARSNKRELPLPPVAQAKASASRPG